MTRILWIVFALTWVLMVCSAETDNSTAVKDVILSGVQPTGILHLGNYLGAIKNWVRMQKMNNTERYYCIVDLHSITTKYLVEKKISEDGPEPDIDELTYRTAAGLLACGIDIKKSHLFVQSHVAAHSELTWILMSMSPMSWLNTMIQYKEKKKNADFTAAALLNYP